MGQAHRDGSSAAAGDGISLGKNSGVTGTVEGVVRTTIGRGADVLECLWSRAVECVGGAKLPRKGQFGLKDINRDDGAGTGCAGTQNCTQPNSTKAENGH